MRKRPKHRMSIEQRFDVPLIAEMALREKQIQQNYRPIIGVHKWFARRPGTLFRGLLLAEFGDGKLADTFFRSNDLSGIRVADPFMGGGTPLIEANRLGCDVQGFDVNPMSAWIVDEEIKGIDLDAYGQAANSLIAELDAQVGRYYRTACPLYGDADVPVKSFLWVKTLGCESCGESIDLFPGYLIADDTRHPLNVLVCPSCGDLNEVPDRKKPGRCASCDGGLRQEGPARRGKLPCPHCHRTNTYPKEGSGATGQRLYALEYHNPARKSAHKGRFFKKPDTEDLRRFSEAAKQWEQTKPRFVPDQAIPPGDETNRLHRWGYSRYRDLFTPRQLLGLELSCRLISEVRDKRIRHALATNLSDLLRYQNMLCRYHATMLKTLDIFSVHGFPVGLVQCESNLLGIDDSGKGIGSGGWSNIVRKYTKAKNYCRFPFEVRRIGSRKMRVPTPGEWIGEKVNGNRRSVSIHAANTANIELPPESLDAVLTDPPYFGNVQYGELMDFCYAWLRRLIGTDAEGFAQPSARSAEELTGNATQGRGLEHFAEGLSAIYSRMAAALKPGAPLAFTYHHNKPETYCAVATAILDAGLACTTTLPCPAEMGGSIHILGTKSSLVDTVFVCRKLGTATARQAGATPDNLAQQLARDVADLRKAGYEPTPGDIRCLIFGHLTRLAVQSLRKTWEHAKSIVEKLATVQIVFTKPVGFNRSKEKPDAKSRDRLDYVVPFITSTISSQRG